jgi:hypothetical protein
MIKKSLCLGQSMPIIYLLIVLSLQITQWLGVGHFHGDAHYVNLPARFHRFQI